MIYNPEIETMPLEQLRKLQNQRLSDLLARVDRDVPFYHESWSRAGVDISRVNSVEDLPLLPFTKKSDLRDHYPYGMFATAMDKVRRIHASSGTTGKPTVVGYTAGDLVVFDEVVARSLVCAGARPGMKLHNAYGYGLFTGGLGMHGGATQLGMAVIPVSGGMTERQITILRDFAPEVICCTPSYALTLAETCAQQGISGKELEVKYAILGAEPWTEAVRQAVEDQLNVKATNIYGLSEIMGPGVSQEDVDERGSGSHIWEDHFYPEIVDPETGSPLPLGSEGVLVFTTLSKEAFPLIRYWTNDICSLHYDPHSKRTHVKMSPIKGRADDMLIIRGVNVYPTQVESVLSTFKELTANYQLVLTGEAALDKLEVKVEALKAHDLLDEEIALKIKGTIGISAEVSIVPRGTIPRSQGGKLNRVSDQR